MGIFGTTKAATAPEIDWQAHVEALAVEAEKAALADAPAKLAEYLAEHERQVAGFTFDCRRHGDFMALFITRRSNSGESSPWWIPPQVDTAITINLGSVRTITLKAGNPPGGEHELSYSLSQEPDTPQEEYYFRGLSQTWPPPRLMPGPDKYHHYVVKPKWWATPTARASFAEDQPNDGPRGHIMTHGSVKLKTPDMPRPAKDDAIRFEGIASTLYAPAGCGQVVLDAIHAEIARGAGDKSARSD